MAISALSALNFVQSLLPYLDKGGATLFAACIAAVVSIVGLVFTIRSAKSQSRLVSKLSDGITINKEAREYKLKQLTLFYDPIFTLLAANRSIFDRIGPRSDARKDGRFNSDETAEVWKKLSKEVIVPNNMRICEIISGNLHFMANVDKEALYLEFIIHANAYKIFKEEAYEAYTLFQFPTNFFASVQTARMEVRNGLRELYSSTNDEVS